MALPNRIRWPVLGALALASACNDQPTAPLPDQFVVTRPPALVGAPGFPMMDTIFVRVLDASGNARPGVPVTWGVRDGGGSVLPLTEVSGTDGTTAAIWTLGPKPGYNELRVSISEESSYTFTATGEVFRASEVASDFYGGCGLVDGAIWCWGRGAPAWGAPASNYDSAHRQSPHYTNLGPGLFDDSREYTDLAVGLFLGLCALDAQGSVWCRTGYGDIPLAPVPGFPPLRRGSLVGSEESICGLAEADGRAWCLRDSVVAMVAGSPSFTLLRAERNLSCGLQADSTAACWSSVVPVGDGSSTPSPTPVTISGGHRFVDLIVGWTAGCGRTAAGELWCWGTPGRRLETWLEPRLFATNVTLAGVSDEFLLLSTAGSRLSRGWDLDFGLETQAPLLGLENVAVASLPEGEISCVSGAEDEVYCVEEMWNSWTGFHYRIYLPVMPVRQAPPAPAVLR